MSAPDPIENVIVPFRSHGPYDPRMTTADIIRNIDTRLADIQREIANLHQARAQLVNGADPAASIDQAPAVPDPATAAAVTPRPTRSRTNRAKAARIVPAGVLERLLADSDGLTTTQLAAQAGADRDQVLTLLKELEATGRVRRSGERRATRWRLFTEEDAIAERAAELAARSRTWGPKPTEG